MASSAVLQPLLDGLAPSTPHDIVDDRPELSPTSSQKHADSYYTPEAVVSTLVRRPRADRGPIASPAELLRWVIRADTDRLLDATSSAHQIWQRETAGSHGRRTLRHLRMICRRTSTTAFAPRTDAPARTVSYPRRRSTPTANQTGTLRTAAATAIASGPSSPASRDAATVAGASTRTPPRPHGHAPVARAAGTLSPAAGRQARPRPATMPSSAPPSATVPGLPRTRSRATGPWRRPLPAATAAPRR